MTRTVPRPRPTSPAHALLSSAVDEAARLLKVDGALVYLVEPETQLMRYEVDAGISNTEARALMRELTLPVGVGLFGHCVATREVVVSGDYRGDDRFTHSPVADRIVTMVDMRSMAAAPLIAEGDVLGALGAYSSRTDAFGEADVALLRALADHAAAAIANQRLIERLGRSQEELARRVDAQRTLGEITARIAVIGDPEEVLHSVVGAARRLLGSDGAHLTQMLPGGAALSPSVVASDSPAWTEEWLAELEFPVGGGINGLAAERCEVISTEDYRSDDRIPHEMMDEQVAERLGLRGMAAAPLRGLDGAVIGTLAVSFEEPHRFSADELALLQGLADQGAIAISNARLLRDQRDQAAELAHRVEAQRTLAEMAAQLSSIREPQVVLTQTLRAAVRLLEGDGGQIGIVGPDETGVIRWGEGHSLVRGKLRPFTKRDRTRADDGVSGRAVREGHASWTDDYLADTSFPHADESDAAARRLGIRAVIAAPLTGEQGAIGAIGVYAERPNVFDAADAELLELLASQAAVAITNARLYEQLTATEGGLRRQGDLQRRLLNINRTLLSTLDSESVLQLIADGLKSVVWYDYLGVYRSDHDEGVLRPVLARDRNAEAVLSFTIPRGEGITWWSVEHREPVLLNNALSDPRVIQIPGTPAEEEAIIIVPLISGEEVIGAMNIARRGGPEVAFTEADFELVQLFAGQAAVAITNARLYDALRERADAQRALAEIAAEIASLHEPQTMLSRAVAEAARLLRADRAQINLVDEAGTHLERPITAAPEPPSPDDVTVPIGSGIAGLAASERRVRWTGDYLEDRSFPHDEGDARIADLRLHSMMSAPLIGSDRLIGTITVQSSERDAFGEDQAALLKLLADQAAIAVTNARLYAEVEESERRYRHLVDNSPDIVWSADAGGRLTFLSDSLESRTGWTQEQLIGKRFTVLTGPMTRGAASSAWRQLRREPHREQRVRLDLPLSDGRVAQAEVAMTGTVIDGRFAGAHGSVRDISERERLEGDLRRQAAELAASQERAHLARELHDSVTQALFSMGLTLRTLELMLESDREDARAKVAELRELQKDALAEMRTLIFELRPSSLETDGLVQALRTHATAVQRRTGLAIVVDAEPIERLALEKEEALYRIGQEALHNVVKHANASHASIRVVRDGDDVRLSVTDDGTGFEPEEIPRGHLGLIGMRQRADLVGGELRVESHRNQGTTVQAAVPA